MRITIPAASARFGDIEICGVQSVVELEALEFPLRSSSQTRGQETSPFPSSSSSNKTQAVPPSDINAIQSRTAIVVPCKDEALDHIQGVLAAIPASSLIILVSGSEDDRYAIECNALIDFCNTTGRNGMAIHQRDPKVADALRAAGMSELIDDAGDGLVHKGKGEGLVIGIALAAIARGPGFDNAAAHETDGRCGSSLQPTNETTAADVRCDGSYLRTTSHGNPQFSYSPANGDNGSSGCKSARYNQQKTSCRTDGAPGYYKYIGFVDADNFVPGSVQEYCRAFSAGMYLANAEDAMVRINWSSKPKVEDGKLHFKPSGRSSEIVNRWLNRLLKNMEASIVTNNGENQGGETTDLICTGNAGEHAMTISLALKLRVASGYAIEPFHFLDLFERFAGESRDLAIDGATKMHQLQQSSATAVTCDNPVPDMPMSPELSPIGTPLGSSPMLSACDESTMPTSPSVLSTSLGKIPQIERLPPPLTSPAAYHVALGQDQNLADDTPPDSPTFAVPPAKIQILQIRTINPHFHDNKGDDHVVRMWKQGLSAIYHSSVATSFTQYREDLRAATFFGGEREGVPTPPFSTSASVATSPSLCADDAVEDGAVVAAANWQPAKCRIYQSPGSMDLLELRERLEKEDGSFWCSGIEDELGADMESDPASGLSLDLLGLGPISRVKRPEGDVDGFKACVDEGL